MKIRNISTSIALAGVLMATAGCKDFYDVNTNPLSPSKVDLRDLLPVTQVSMASGLGDNTNGLSQYTMALMTQLYNTRGINNYQQTGDSFANAWSTLYSDMLVNNEQIIKQGTTEQQWGYVGVAQLQKAYVFSQMVDVWGDIPYSEALQGATNTAPHFDKDSDIYNGSADGKIQGLFSLIDEGLANLAKPSTNIQLTSVDLIYKGNLAKWSRFGRTLKLKLYNQLRKTTDVATFRSQVTPLLAADLIDSGDDFELPYYNSLSPDNRNLGYIADYGNAAPESRIGRYFYEDMFTKNDPRIRYYFYRQSSTPISGQDYVSPLDPRFSTVRPGSTGQYASTISSTQQTVQGLYPIGGKYDDGSGQAVTAISGKGSVAQRLLTYFSRKYTEAEIQLMAFNDAVAARTALRTALYASFNKVNTIAIADGSPQIDTTSTGSGGRYILTALRGFDRATSAEAKLAVVMYEKYVASFGYGVDVYTDFRRTTYPNIHVSQQAADASRGLLPDDGGTVATAQFPRRFYYATNDLLLNPNSPRVQKDPVTSRIFWDR